MTGTTPLASHFARRELRPASVHGMEDPAAATSTASSSTAPPSNKARTAEASRPQRHTHGGEEATEKMLSRLTSKLQEKRKTFAFGFAVPDGEIGGGGEESSGGDGRTLDDLVRELEGGRSMTAREKNRKAKKERTKLAKKEAAAKGQTTGSDGCVGDEGSRSSSTSAAVTPSTAPSLAANNNNQEQSKKDEAAASMPPPRQPLGPPPGLPEPDIVDDTTKTKAKKKRARKKKKSSAAVPKKEEEEKEEKEEAAAPKDVVVLHWDSWKEAATEEEKLRKRFGQGTRNVTAIARRGEKKGVGVIGHAGGAVTAAAGKEGGTDGAEALTNAFSFGFAL